MEFIETIFFTRKFLDYISDGDYADVQSFLSGHPDSGRLIRGSGGLRKLRWASSLKARGKRGGIRIIYYRMTVSRIYMLDIYSKNKKASLSIDELKSLSSYLKG